MRQSSSCNGVSPARSDQRERPSPFWEEAGGALKVMQQYCCIALAPSQPRAVRDWDVVRVVQCYSASAGSAGASLASASTGMNVSCRLALLWARVVLVSSRLLFSFCP